MLFVKSDSHDGGVPGGGIADHRVEDGEELSHASDEGDLRWLTGDNQALMEGAKAGVGAARGERGHRRVVGVHKRGHPR